MPTDPHHRAKAYPYARPDHSYVFDGGENAALPDNWIGDAALLRGRTPVLAFGSNAAPEQLRRKFANSSHKDIPVLRARLAGFDVVYSAHLTAYGAVPATLALSPGTELETWVTWLTPAQLEIMHASEMGSSAQGAAVNYAYGTLSDLELSFEDGFEAISRAGAYLSNHGALGLEGAPLALAQIPAGDRRFRALTKLDVLEAVRRCLARDLPLDDFISAAVSNRALRAEWTEQLRQQAFRLGIENFAPEAT